MDLDVSDEDEVARSALEWAVHAPWRLETHAVGGPDVEADLLAFGSQYRFLADHDQRLPCLVAGDGEPWPIDLRQTPDRSMLSGEWYERGRGEPQSPEGDLRMLAEESGFEYAEFDPDVGQSFFARRLARFLPTRLRHSERSSPGFPGQDFVVETDTPGLRVHFSPAYWASPRVFGSPTTPVRGSMQPGRWIFGADGQGMPLRWDRSEYDVPPQGHAVLYL